MKISIVTPSFNQNRFLEQSMRSVLRQEIGDLEYIVMDGGSTDGSMETIQRHADRLTHWESRPGLGCTGALQSALDGCHGEIIGWIHPGDELVPWALRVVEGIFSTLPEVDWLTTVFPLEIDDGIRLVSAHDTYGYNADAFYRGQNAPLSPGFFYCSIQRASTFWRRSLWERSGSRLGQDLHMAVDFELWARFFQHAHLFGAFVPLGCARIPKDAFTAEECEKYLAECRTILRRYSHALPSRIEMGARRIARQFPRQLWPSSGLAYPVETVHQQESSVSWSVVHEWMI
jgi:glycosyltransferase involved in cell wall biosynthesis